MVLFVCQLLLYLVLLNVTEWRLYHNELLLLHSSLSSLLTCDYGFTIILSVSYFTFIRYQHIVYMCEYHSFLSRKNHALDEWIITALINWMTHKSHSHILQTMSFVKDLKRATMQLTLTSDELIDVLKKVVM